MVSWPDRLLPGAPYPLGATWDGLGTNFAVFSAHATKLELCLFDPSGRREIQRFELPECTDEVWHGYLPNARAGLIYGYRAHGPYEPQHGHRFNHHKLLLDPYARRLAGELRMSDALYAFMGTPSTGFDRPIFLGVGLLDRDVPPESTLSFYHQLVANNQNVTLHVYPEEDHSGTVLASLPDSTPFLREAFAAND